eukprot:10204212-Ditylum_brightwellii.AAC.1
MDCGERNEVAERESAKADIALEATADAAAQMTAAVEIAAEEDVAENTILLFCVGTDKSNKNMLLGIAVYLENIAMMQRQYGSNSSHLVTD